ncbi:hypothetical protein VRR38_004708 [Salmonella enterica]|nr:hypothetical protein [Salmonella enterica]EMD7130155.1 hypothetical protein [Salmonella enterica]
MKKFLNVITVLMVIVAAMSAYTSQISDAIMCMISALAIHAINRFTNKVHKQKMQQNEDA